MMFIKKLLAVLATIGIAIIRVPMTWILAGFNWVDIYLVKLTVKLGKVIDWYVWTEALDEALERNSIGFECISEYFEELQEDLA